MQNILCSDRLPVAKAQKLYCKELRRKVRKRHDTQRVAPTQRNEIAGCPALGDCMPRLSEARLRDYTQHTVSPPRQS